jgi:nitroimidazol reductase NimA-like FMN-containing flavoprotein (pyridoxamine 5'-phosphate oxidase superfamily)
VYDDGWIYARTAPGTKLSTLVHRPWVALQADEVRSDFDWESVVAKGTVYFVEDDDTPRGAELRENVIALLRRVLPGVEAISEMGAGVPSPISEMACSAAVSLNAV